MEYKDKFAQLLLSARAKKEQQLPGHYNQRALAARLGISQTVYSKWEGGNFDRLPDPSMLGAIGKELDLTSVELLDAAGYDVGIAEVEEAKLRKMVQNIDLAEFLHRKYGDIQSYQSLATTLEELIESRRIREHRMSEKQDNK